MKIYTVILLSMIIILSGCSNISNKKIENSLWGVNKNDPPNLIKLTIVIM